MKYRIVYYLAPWLFLFYAISSNRIVGSNDGSHVNLVRAIVEDHQFSLNPQRQPLVIDFAKVGETYYSDRPPGTAFLSIPFYAAVKIARHVFHFLKPYPQEIFAPLLPALLGTLSVMLLYLIAELLGASSLAAFLTALTYALGTLNWRYSTALFSHVPAAFFVLLATYLALRLAAAPASSSLAYFLLGGVLGFLMVTEYVSVLLLPSVVLFVGVRLLREHSLYLSARLRRIITGIFGFLIGALPLLVYNNLCFGSPLKTAYAFHASFLWAHSFSETFSTPLLSGIHALLFGLPNRGVLFHSPVIWLGLIGYYYLWRSRPAGREALFFAAAFLPAFLLLAKHRSYYGGGSMDTRYIFFVTPFLVIPIAATLDRVRDAIRSRRYEYFPMQWGIAFLIAAPMSLVNQARAMLAFPGHDYLAPASNAQMPFYLYVSQTLFALFPSYKQFWFFFYAFLIVFLLALLARALFLRLFPRLFAHPHSQDVH